MLLVLLQTYDLGLSFADMWTAALGFMTGDLLGPFLLATGGFFVAILFVRRLVMLIWGGNG